MKTIKKVLELLAYIAVLIAIALYSLTGGYSPKTAQTPELPKSSYEHPSPEPRQGQILEGV